MAIKSVPSSQIKHEYFDWNTLVLNHLQNLSLQASLPPVIEKGGTVIDCRPMTLFYMVRMLDCWMRIYAISDEEGGEGSAYDKEVVKRGYRNMVMPHPTSIRNQAIIRDLFNWHELQTTLFFKLGIAPRSRDDKPLGMEMYKEEEKKGEEGNAEVPRNNKKPSDI